MKHDVKFGCAKLLNFALIKSEKKTNRMARIFMIGAGNVATHLSQALQKNGHEITQVFSKTQSNAISLSEKLGCSYTNELHNIDPCDIAIIAVKDDVINEVASLLNCRIPIVHTSGTKDLAILGKGVIGVFYPLQTFSKNKIVDFQNIPICIEANNSKFLQFLNNLANSISNNVHQLSSEQRNYLHLSAVMVNNFSNLMYQMATEICEKNKISFDLLKPLIQETSNKVQQMTAIETQTGPARRKDVQTIERHLTLLDSDKEKRKIYEILTESILNRS